MFYERCPIASVLLLMEKHVMLLSGSVLSVQLAFLHLSGAWACWRALDTLGRTRKGRVMLYTSNIP